MTNTVGYKEEKVELILRSNGLLTSVFKGVVEGENFYGRRRLKPLTDVKCGVSSKVMNAQALSKCERRRRWGLEPAKRQSTLR